MIKGSVDLKGKVTGTGKGPDSGHSADYDGSYTVTVKYSIATKTDSSGKKVFDLKKSTVKFTDSKYRWTTLPIPITEVDGDPATGKIRSFKFKGKKWYPGAADADIVDNGISGSVKIDPKKPKKGTGTIKASYTFDSGATELTYSFVATAPKKKPQKTPPKSPPKKTKEKPMAGKASKKADSKK